MPDMPRYHSFDVEVHEGRLHAGRWGEIEPASPVVLAAHGVTASHMVFPALAEALHDDATVVAPDLRGRGRSRDVSGPFGMDRHADDLVAVLDHLGVERALVLGHSMGGFVAVVMGHRYRDRVTGLVLVDGGVPLRVPPDLPLDELIQALIGPAAERLRMTFPSRDGYHDFWRAHPAMAEWNEHIQRYVDYDLVGEPPELRPSCPPEALRADTEDLLREGHVDEALLDLRHPAILVRAPRGLLDEVPPLYPDEYAREWSERVPGLRQTRVPDVNHYTILLSEHGAAAVAEVVRAEVAARP